MSIVLFMADNGIS